MLSNVLAALNPLQRKAVEHLGGPLEVVAGPGTGKTRVLTARIWHLIHGGHAGPGQVLAITFTNQAAKEIRERIAAVLGQGRDVPRVATFHHWSLELLKGVRDRGPFNLVDESGARELKGWAARQAGVTQERLRRVIHAMGLAKQHWPPGFPGMDEETARSLDYYQERLKDYRLWDFDDLILEAIRCLEEDEGLRRRIQDETPFLLVDEFQDVSPAQYRLVRHMARPGMEVTVIGDPDQSIYGFRGASPEFLARFKEDFHPVTTVTLKSCYRSTQVVLDAAEAVLSSDRGLVSEKGRGKLLVCRSFKDPGAEARWVAATIERLCGGLSFEAMNFGRAGTGDGMSLGSIAVLFRTRAVGDRIAEELSRKGVPFCRADHQDPLAALGLLPVHHILEAARGRNQEYHVRRLEGMLGKERLRELPAFLKALQGVEGVDLLDEVLDFYGVERDSSRARLLKRLYRGAGDAASFSLLLRNEADLLEVDIEGVRLLSLHASKGLEFQAVFMVGCDRGIIPWEGSPVEEERRLFYVGVTRAALMLHISSSGRRFLQGRSLPGLPSPFLESIPRELFEPVQGGRGAGSAKRARRPRQRRLF